MIRDAIWTTQWVDTHEHLLEEADRLAEPRPDDRMHPCEDWSYLYAHYAQDDLLSAGMPAADAQRVFGQELGPLEKWDLFEPWWRRTRHTGYMRAVELTIQKLYGLAVGRDACEEITTRMRELRRPGFYRHVLRDVAQVESCQVNSLREIFCETAQPDLLLQDLGFIHLCVPETTAAAVCGPAGIEPGSLNDYLRAVDWWFDRFGDDAVAIKNQWAYSRRLHVEVVDAADAAAIFAQHLRGDALSRTQSTALQDFLFEYCVRKAADYGLPVKLHTGYYAGTGGMPLHRVRDNLPDLCPVLARHPDVTFVLMHTAYPYTHEAIAIAKQYPNAYVDLCWAWIIDPITSEDFVRRFLVTAPHSKLLCFGADYFLVEPVVGHAEIARRGLASALEGLVRDGHLNEPDATGLVTDLMRTNAERVFPRVAAAREATRAGTAQAR